MSVHSIAHKSADSAYPTMTSASGLIYTVETISPTKAKEWLASNVDNRRLRKAVASRYARDMKAGNWTENGAAITFAKDGTLLDGQHRLAAVVEAKRSVVALVVRGLPNHAQDTMDDQAKRTLGDTFAFHGIGGSNQAAAIVRRVLLWQNGIRTNSGSAFQPTKQEALDLLRSDHSLVVAIEAAAKMQHRRRVSPSIMGLTWWLFWNIDADDCEAFWQGLHTGADLAVDSPIYIVREQIIRSNDRAERVPETAYLAWIIKAWNHYRTDFTPRPTYRYNLGSADRFPEPK